MRSTKHFIILEYPQEILMSLICSEKLCLWEDFYKELGLFPIFQTYNLNVEKEDDRFNYKLIRCSQDSLLTMENVLKANLLKSNRKDIKFYNKEGRLKKFAWNAFYCAPYTHPEKTKHIDGLEVWIPKHFIATECLDDMMSIA